MKKFRNMVYGFLIGCGIFTVYQNPTFAFSFSPPPDGLTGSPADNSRTCRECHGDFALNSGSARFSISAPGNYTAGEVLDITVSFNNSTTAKHGFELSALDANNTHVGTFSPVDNNTQTVNGDYIKQTTAGSNLPGNARWNVQWTAPTSGVADPITFYACGVEANADFSDGGDRVYTVRATVTDGSIPIPTPTLVVTPTPIPTVSPTAPPPTPTPEPTVSPTATPVATPPVPPSIITAEVKIKPKTINLNSKSKSFRAYIELPSPYSGNDVTAETVTCEGAHAASGKTDKDGRYVATFKIRDLKLESNNKNTKARSASKRSKRYEKEKFTVSGELEDGTRFSGSDSVKVMNKEEYDHDDNDNDRGDDHDDDDDDDRDNDRNDDHDDDEEDDD